MMYNYDLSDEHEFLTVCQYYFEDKADGGLGADWYLSSLFVKHCDKWGIVVPTWFKGE